MCPPVIGLRHCLWADGWPGFDVVIRKGAKVKQGKTKEKQGKGRRSRERRRRSRERRRICSVFWKNMQISFADNKTPVTFALPIKNWI
jgi:hypothetical protein